MSQIFEMKSNVKEFKNATLNQVHTALQACGLIGEGYAKLKCPVDTGNLRNSITHQTDVANNSEYIGTNVDYGVHVELGTYKMRARPFLKPAVEQHSDEYTKAIKQYLSN